MYGRTSPVNCHGTATEERFIRDSLPVYSQWLHSRFVSPPPWPRSEISGSVPGRSDSVQRGAILEGLGCGRAMRFAVSGCHPASWLGGSGV